MYLLRRFRDRSVKEPEDRGHQSRRRDKVGGNVYQSFAVIGGRIRVRVVGDGVRTIGLGS